MANSWDHLPNAKHIDRIIDSLKTNPKLWSDLARDKTWYAARDASWDVAWKAVWKAVYNAAWDETREAACSAACSAARDAARSAARDAIYDAARDAILALVAYDDCSYMLGSAPGELAILAKFGDPKAILLLPVCKLFNKR